MKLNAYAPFFGEPSGSPFCVKAMCLLEMAGGKWQLSKDVDPRKAPKQKLPTLTDNGKTIADSDAIRDYLEEEFDMDFDDGLSAEQRAISRALIRMTEENLYFGIVCDRWINDDNWPHIRKAYFSEIPKLINGFITKKIRQQAIGSTKGQGMGRHSEQERFERCKKDIDAIATLLGDKPYLFGNAPKAADISVVTFLRAMAAAPEATLNSNYINAHKTLPAYLQRGKDALYPQEVVKET